MSSCSVGFCSPVLSYTGSRLQPSGYNVQFFSWKRLLIDIDVKKSSITMSTAFNEHIFLWGPDRHLGFLYIRAKVKAKAIFFFDLLPLTHRCSINTQVGNNATDWKRHRFRFPSNINAP